MASTLTVDNIVGATTAANVKLPEGCVLQTKSMVYTNNDQSASGTTFTDTGLTVTITPKYATSKIYVMSHVSMGATNGYRFALRLVRGSTNILLGDQSGNRSRATVSHQGSGGNIIDQTLPIFFLDSPATTNATTYKIQAAAEQAGGTWYMNRGGAASDNSTVYVATSSLSVMEVAQ